MSIIAADTWQDIDLDWWQERWPNFHPSELISRGNGGLRVVVPALDMLQELRNQMGRGLRINSAYRDPVYNARINGAKFSRHKVGDAFDISLKNLDREALTAAAIALGFNGIGQYHTFVHVDARPRRARWDRR